jgi:hypothetical protein
VNELASGMADLHDNEHLASGITTETMFPAFREAFLKNKKIKNKLVRAENSVRAGMINSNYFRGPN